MSLIRLGFPAVLVLVIVRVSSFLVCLFPSVLAISWRPFFYDFSRFSCLSDFRGLSGCSAFYGGSNFSNFWFL